MTGEEDFFDSANGTPSIADIIVGGNYQIGQDGRGSLTANVNLPGSPSVPDLTVGVGGLQTFSVVVANDNHLLIQEFDSAATSSGSMDFQTFTASDLTQLNGGFSYIVSGEFGSEPLGYGGVFSTDGAGGFGSDEGDTNGNGTLNTGYTGLGGGFTAPDANGRGVSLSALSPSHTTSDRIPEALTLVEIDGFELGVGVALGQGSSVGAFHSRSNWKFGFGANGETGFGLASIAGQFATDGAAAFTGFAELE